MRVPLVPAVAILAACADPAEPPPPSSPLPSAPAGLEVVASAPVNGAVGVARSATIALVFSAPVNLATVNEGTVGLWREAESVPATLSAAGATAQLVPRDLLDLNTTYVVTVRREVQDTAGRPMVREFRLVFMTKVNRIP